jgi:mRNA-degrading endonuclease RelE of RelBE toxin-antitoxin system
MDKWIIDEESKNSVFEESIKGNDTLVEKWDLFKADVTKNPFYNPKPKRIEKLKGEKTFPPGTYRYKREPLRVVYYPESSTKTVFPLEAATSTQISYKKRTRGK